MPPVRSVPDGAKRSVPSAAVRSVPSPAVRSVPSPAVMSVERGADFESLVLMRLRQAEERKRLNQQLSQEEPS